MVSASGFCHPSYVVDVVVVTFDGDVVFEACCFLDDVFSNEWVVECGIESGD